MDYRKEFKRVLEQYKKLKKTLAVCESANKELRSEVKRAEKKNEFSVDLNRKYQKTKMDYLKVLNQLEGLEMRRRE
jgi:SMC interacting uncharacterized protein involved in chromosome segregation